MRENGQKLTAKNKKNEQVDAIKNVVVEKQATM